MSQTSVPASLSPLCIAPAREAIPIHPMGHRFPPEEIEFYRRTDEVLHYIWDPIGVSGSSSARDEYHSYLPGVFAMLKEGSSKDAISWHLKNIEEDHMGLSPQPEHDTRRVKTVNLLLEHRDQFIPTAGE